MTQKELDIIENQNIPFDELDNLSYIVNIEHCNSFTEVIKVYLYGVIQGKRQERNRRKKSTDKSKYML